MVLLQDQYIYFCFYFSLRAWDTITDLMQFEHQGVIKTQTRHRVPMVNRTMSSANISSSMSPALVERAKAQKLPSFKEPIGSDAGSRRNSCDRFVNYTYGITYIAI